MPNREKDQITGEEPSILERPVMILIVENDETLRALLELCLRIEGYQVVTAATLQGAQAAREEHGLANFALVITDLNLSPSRQEWGGYQLYQNWTTIEPELPFLLISADEASYSLSDVRSGALSLIPKPFSFESLLDSVRQKMSASTRHAPSN